MTASPVGSPFSSRCLSVRSYDSTSRSTPTAVRTRTLPSAETALHRAAEGAVGAAHAGVGGDGGARLAARRDGDPPRRHGEHALGGGLAVHRDRVDGQIEGDRLRTEVAVRHLLGRRGVVAVRPLLETEVERRLLGDDALVQRPDQVGTPGALLEGAVRARLGRAREERLDALAGPVGMLLGEDRGGARDMRGRHGGAADGEVAGYVGGVLLRQGAAGGRRGRDVDAGRGQVGLDPGVPDPRATAGEVGEPVGLCRPRRR